MMSKKYNVGGKQKRRQQRNRRVFLFGMLSIVVLFILCVWATEKKRAQEERLKENPSFIGAPPFEVELLDINEYSRPGIPLEKINGIVVHYTANPGSTAEENRNYFESRQAREFSSMDCSQFCMWKYSNKRKSSLYVCQQARYFNGRRWKL